MRDSTRWQPDLLLNILQCTRQSFTTELSISKCGWGYSIGRVLVCHARGPSSIPGTMKTNISSAKVEKPCANKQGYFIYSILQTSLPLYSYEYFPMSSGVGIVTPD